MEKHPKLVLSNWNGVICVLFLLILLPSEVNIILKKKYSKTNAVGALGSSSNKIILILLIEVITFYIRFIAIYV